MEIRKVPALRPAQGNLAAALQENSALLPAKSIKKKTKGSQRTSAARKILLESDWALRHGGLDVGLAEVVAFEEKRLAGGFGQGIGETVAEIEASWMAALAKIREALPCDERLFFREWGHGDARTAEKGVPLANDRVSTARFNDDRDLDETSGGDGAKTGVHDSFKKDLESRLTEQDGQKG